MAGIQDDHFGGPRREITHIHALHQRRPAANTARFVFAAAGELERPGLCGRMHLDHFMQCVRCAGRTVRIRHNHQNGKSRWEEWAKVAKEMHRNGLKGCPVVSFLTYLADARFAIEPGEFTGSPHKTSSST